MQRGPWEDYKKPAEAEGPWTEYQKAAPPPADNSAILAQQKAKYPTSAEQGGIPGQAAIAPAGPQSKAAILGAELLGAVKSIPQALPDTANLANRGIKALTGINFGEAKLPSWMTPQGPEEEMGATAANVGMLAGAGVGAIREAAPALGKWAAENTNLAKIYNRASGVKAGRGGVEVNMATGGIKTNPGNAAVRAAENAGRGRLGQISDAAFAKPNEGLRVRVNSEFNRSNNALQSHLGQFKQAEDFTIPDLKKAHEAVGAAGLSADDAGKVSAVPLDLHKLRRELGDRINWNPDVVSEANDELKSAWFELTDKLNSIGGKAMPKLNKEFQEAYLYQKALKRQLENVESGKKASTSLARRTVKSAIPIAKTVGGLGVAGEVIHRLIP